MDISAITYSLFIPLLNTIHEFSKTLGLQSWGWSIVFLTILVKLILTPLTFKQIKSTKKMQVVQPKLKKLQEDLKKKESQYQKNPEKLKQVRAEFQQKMMSFYKENDVNPLGGCLPLIVQMPILLGLFWTFSGAPFQAKPIFVDVKVVSKDEIHRREIKPASRGEIFVDAEGRRARIALNTKGITLVEGEEYILETSRITGDAELNPSDIKWGFLGGNNKQSNESVSIQVLADGRAEVIATKSGGSAKIQAELPSTLKSDSFFFIKDFGHAGVFDKSNGQINVDILILVILFGLSIWLSSSLNTPKLPEPKAGEAEDPQVAMQRSMATMMPIMMTAMMFFIPLPAGAFLYMVVSSFIQSGQTYFAMKRYDKS